MFARLVAALLGAALALSPGVSSAEGPQNLSLREAVAVALAQNPRLAQARAEVSARAAEVGIARGAFDTSVLASLDAALTRRPAPDLVDGALSERSVGGTVGYMHRLEGGGGVGVSLSHRYNDSAGILTVLAPQFSTDVRVTASQPLLRGFGSDLNLALIRSATTRQEAAELQLLRSAELLAAQVAQAYWSLARIRDEVGIRRRAFERSDKIHALTQELIKRGSLAAAALAQATSTRALRKARLEASERLLRSAESELAQAILGQAPERLTATDALPEPAATLPKEAIERADVKAFVLFAAAQSQELVVAEDGVRPSLELGLFGGLAGLGGSRNEIACRLFTPPGGPGPAGCRDGGDFDGYSRTWTALVTGGFYTAGISATLELPVINEGAESRAARARIAVEQARLAAEGVRREAEVEALYAWELAQADRAALETAKAARQATTQLVEVEEQRYRIGSATTFDVLRVQDDLAEAEVLTLAAHTAVLLSDVRYNLATGRLLAYLGLNQVEGTERAE